MLNFFDLKVEFEGAPSSQMRMGGYDILYNIYRGSVPVPLTSSSRPERVRACACIGPLVER